MDCKDLQTKLWDASLPSTALPPEEAAHVNGCAECAAVVAQVTALKGVLTLEVDGKALDESVGRVGKRLKGRIMSDKKNEPIVYLSNSPNNFSQKFFSIATAVAAMICIGVYIAKAQLLRKSANANAQVINVVQSPILHAVAVKNEQAVIKKPSASELFERLKREYAQSDKTREDLERIINLAKEAIAQWPDSPDAYKLIADCYREMGEVELCRKAFMDYAEAVGRNAYNEAMESKHPPKDLEKVADNATVSTILSEAIRLFKTNDYLVSLSYFDEIKARYPQHEDAACANLYAGKYYDSIHDWEQAAAQAKIVISDYGDSYWAIQAYSSLSRYQMNLNQYDAALATMDANYEHFDSDNIRAGILYNKGTMYQTMGLQYTPDAIACFKQLVKTFPNQPYSSVAKKVLTQLVSQQ